MSLWHWIDKKNWFEINCAKLKMHAQTEVRNWSERIYRPLQNKQLYLRQNVSEMTHYSCLFYLQPISTSCLASWMLFSVGTAPTLGELPSLPSSESC